jgi:branched-chain amino acid transport system permease protein
MTAGDALVQLLGGLASASTLFLVASGITLIFGALRILNVAHGSFYMFGAFGLSSLLAVLPGGGMPFLLAIVLVPLAVAALGALVEMTVLRRVYQREHLAQLLATFALFYIFADLARQLWGNQYRTIVPPPFLASQVAIGERVFPAYSLFVIFVAVVVALGMFALLQFTLFGWRVRAAVEDPELLASTGTDVKRLSTTLFAIGAGLAALAGAVVAPLQAVTSGMDASILVAAFIVAILGGLGSIVGAALGAVIIGEFQAFGVLLLPQWSSTFIYVVMILVLTFRPAGLLGRAE